MEAAYEHIKNTVGNKVDELVRQWDTEGIIYEGQFGLSSIVLEHESRAVLRFLAASGCDVADTQISILFENVDGVGWKGAIFDLSLYISEEGREMIKKHFGNDYRRHLELC